MSEVYKIQINDSEPIEVSQQVYEVSFCFNEMLKEKDKEIERLNNIINKKEQFLGDNIKRLEREVVKRDNVINGMEKFFQYAYDNEVREINDRKVSVWTICLDKLQELKGSDK